MSSRGVGYDEHAGFDRPRRTRPRTKDRPDYSRAPVGFVVTIDRGRYRVLLEEDAASRHVSAALGAYDTLLDAMASSRGRIGFATSGVAALVVPPWPEIARVIEDCRV